MKKESIEMVSYEKLSYQSDAFLDLNGLEPFINFIVDENYSTQILSLDKYTAGSSDNPDDFSLPEHKHITKPESLLRLNPFNNINKSSILLRSSNNIAKSYPFIENSSEEETQDIPYIADEALELLKYFENNFIELANTKKYDYGSLSVIDKINKYVILLLNERYFSQGTSLTNEIPNLPMTENVKDYGFDPLNPKSLNSQNITNNQNGGCFSSYSCSEINQILLHAFTSKKPDVVCFLLENLKTKKTSDKSLETPKKKTQF